MLHMTTPPCPRGEDTPGFGQMEIFLGSSQVSTKLAALLSTVVLPFLPSPLDFKEDKLVPRDQITASGQTAFCSAQYLKSVLHYPRRKCSTAVIESVLIATSRTEKAGPGHERGAQGAAGRGRVQRLQKEAQAVQLLQDLIRVGPSAW